MIDKRYRSGPIEIMGHSDSDGGSLAYFVEHVCVIFVNLHHPEWEANILQRSPFLGPYQIGRRETEDRMFREMLSVSTFLTAAQWSGSIAQGT